MQRILQIFVFFAIVVLTSLWTTGCSSPMVETEQNWGKEIDLEPQINMIIWNTGSRGPVKQPDLNLKVFSYEIRSLAAHIKSANYKPTTNKTPETVSFSSIRNPDFRKYPLAVQFKFDKHFYFGESQIQTFVFLVDDKGILEILYPKNEKEWYKLSDSEYGLWFKKLYELRLVIPYALDDV